MNITFLIGNGFDIGMGMKSKFKDFFPIYRDISQNKPPHIKQLSEKISDDYDTWADFESAIGRYTLEFRTETKQHLLDQINDFSRAFIQYLKDQEKLISFKNTEQISLKMTTALQKYYSTEILEPVSNAEIEERYINNSLEKHTYNFINFNYTSVLQHILNTIPQRTICRRKNGDKEIEDKIGKIVHVHGSADLYPIIGVNDISQIANKELAKDSRFVRYLVKPSVNRSVRQGNDEKTVELISQSNIICIYGMSIGVTDKKWWNLVLQWLNNNAYRHLIIFDYDNQYTQTTTFGRLSKEDYYIDKFYEYSSNSSINMENLRQRIHIAVNKNIFEFQLAGEKNVAANQDART